MSLITVQPCQNVAASTEGSFLSLCGCKVWAHWPLCRASPVLLQIFSSVIESDGWVVPTSHWDAWTTARNPNLRRGRGRRGPCHIVSCKGHAGSKGKSSPSNPLMRNQRITSQDNCCWLYKVQIKRKENFLTRRSKIKSQLVSVQFFKGHFVFSRLFTLIGQTGVFFIFKWSMYILPYFISLVLLLYFFFYIIKCFYTSLVQK